MKKYFGGGGLGGGDGMIARLLADAGAQQEGSEHEEARKKRESEKAKMTSMKAGGSVSASKRADGCAIKGKTKGAMIKMAKGGKSC